jgi:hypothetical protein
MIPEQKKNPAIAKKSLAHRTDLQSRMQLSIVQANLTLLSFFHGFSWLYCWGRRLSVVSGKEWLCLHKQGLLEAYRRMLAGSMQYKQGFCRFWFMLTQEFTGDPKKEYRVQDIFS